MPSSENPKNENNSESSTPKIIGKKEVWKGEPDEDGYVDVEHYDLMENEITKALSPLSDIPGMKSIINACATEVRQPDSREKVSEKDNEGEKDNEDENDKNGDEKKDTNEEGKDRADELIKLLGDAKGDKELEGKFKEVIGKFMESEDKSLGKLSENLSNVKDEHEKEKSAEVKNDNKADEVDPSNTEEVGGTWAKKFPSKADPEEKDSGVDPEAKDKKWTDGISSKVGAGSFTSQAAGSASREGVGR